MKWDKANKELIYQLLHEKSRPWKAMDRHLLDQVPKHRVHLYDPPDYYDLPGLTAWNEFLDSFGIDRAEKGWKSSEFRGRVCLERSHLLGVWRLVPPYRNFIYPERGRDWESEAGEYREYRAYPKLDYGNPAQSKKHIIIRDPFLDSDLDKGLRIPKDIAEKFLVLGVP